jgi:hypothetical protein
MKKNKELWTAEDELEFQMGDLNGIAFEPVEDLSKQKPPTGDMLTTGKQEVKVNTKEAKIDSWDRPDVLPPAEPFYIERYEGKKKK